MGPLSDPHLAADTPRTRGRITEFVADIYQSSGMAGNAFAGLYFGFMADDTIKDVALSLINFSYV